MRGKGVSTQQQRTKQEDSRQQRRKGHVPKGVARYTVCSNRCFSRGSLALPNIARLTTFSFWT